MKRHTSYQLPGQGLDSKVIFRNYLHANEEKQACGMVTMKTDDG